MRKLRPNPALRTPSAPKRRKAHDPTGRVDILAGRLLGELVKRDTHPVVQQLFEQLKPVVDGELQRLVGPRTKRGRAVREFLEMVRENQQRQRVQRGVAA